MSNVSRFSRLLTDYIRLKTLGKVNGRGCPWWLSGKEYMCNVGDMGSIPGLGRSPREGKVYPLKSSALENSMDCIAPGVTKSWTQLKWLSTHAHVLTSFCWPHLADLCWILTLYFWKWKCCSIGLQMVLNLAFGKMTRMGGFHCNYWFTDCRKKSPFTFQAL